MGKATLLLWSGLALSPLMATCTQYSFDFCLAWALIGEWTSCLLFPVLKGPWPRHGHTDALLPEYPARSPRLVAWARAAFEQGALPSLLLLQGLVPIFTLPGDDVSVYWYWPRKATTSSHARLWRCQDRHGPSAAYYCSRGVAATCCCYGWCTGQVTDVGRLGTSTFIGTTLDIKVAPAPLSAALGLSKATHVCITLPRIVLLVGNNS